MSPFKMKTLVHTVLLAGLVLLSLITFFPCIAYASTLSVPSDYATIQAAVDAAAPGDMVTVASGTYNERVTINKSLSLIGMDVGAGLPVVDAGWDKCMNITGDGVTLQGFNLTNAISGIYINSKNNNVTGNIIHDQTYAIYLNYSSNNTLTGNTVYDNLYGIYIDNSNNNNVTGNTVDVVFSCGIYLNVSSDNTLAGNSVNNNGGGFYLKDSDNNVITGNMVNANDGQGFYLVNSSNNALTSNSASDGYEGIWLDKSNNNDVAENSVNNNSMSGIYLTASSGNSVTGNTAINDTYEGIHLFDNCVDNTLASNTVGSNVYYGIYLQYSSNNNALMENTVYNNANGILIEGSDNNSVTGNTAYDNTNGIRLEVANGNRVSRNVVRNNSYAGINVVVTSSNYLWLNDMANNGANATTLCSNLDSWNSSSRIDYQYNGAWYTNYVGNYWGDYDGADADGDGIGDTPYIIDYWSADNYPMLKSTQAPGPVKNTRNGRTYAAIQAAIYDINTLDGDTVLVDSGTYVENVIVNKSIILKGNDTGAGLPTVVGQGGRGIDITHDGVTIQGFNVKNASRGIRIGSNNNIVKDNAVSNSNDGIYLAGSDNTVTGNTANYNANAGIELVTSSYNSVTGNTADNNTYGIYFMDSDHNNISSNSCRYNDYMGIKVNGTGNNFWLNVIAGNPRNADGGWQANRWYSNMKLNYSYNGVQHRNYVGNYWGDYNGTDANRDGIGDTPYLVNLFNDSRNLDWYPMLAAGEGPSAPRLNVSVQAPSGAYPGSFINYTIHYSNLGDGAASQAIMRDRLSPWADFVYATGGGVYSPANRTITWNMGTIDGYPAENYHGYLTVCVRIRNNATVGAFILNNASLVADGGCGASTHALTKVMGNGLPAGVGVGPAADVSRNNGTISVCSQDEVTFTYVGDSNVTGVGINIRINDDGPGISGNMTGGPLAWHYNVTLYPRHGYTTVNYTVHRSHSADSRIVFSIYVDPAGYVYDVNTGIRVEGAAVWLQRPDGLGGWENVSAGQSPPAMDPDANPLITNADGQYQWNTMPGTYRVHVEAPGYYPADSIIVNVPPAVTDLNVGLSSSAPVMPEANFAVNTSSGTVPMTVQFTDTSQGDPLSWLWDFGDGNTSTEQNPAFTYTLEGVYGVRLTVANMNGIDTEVKNDIITVAPGQETIDKPPTPGVNYNVSLSEGWNLISTPVRPDDGDLDSVFANIKDNVVVVWAYDPDDASGPWRYYVPGRGDNTLVTINEAMGIWVLCDNDTVLTFKGEPIYEASVPISDGGWNLIGHPYMYAFPPGGAYASSIAVWGYEAGAWYLYTTIPGYDSTLTELKPGRGYWVLPAT